VALALVMVLCLLVYRLAEHRLRQQLAVTCQTIPGQQTDRSPDYALGVPVFRRGRSAAYPPRPWP
jgi:transposase